MSLVSLTISSDKINVVTPCTMRRLLEIARTGENLTLTTGHSRNLSLLLMIILAIMAAADDHSCNLSLLPMIILAIRAARKFRKAIKALFHSFHCFHQQIKVHSFNYCIILLPHLTVFSVSEGLQTFVPI